MREQDLKRHIKDIHSESSRRASKSLEYAYRCPACPFGTPRRPPLLLHMATFHPEVPVSGMKELNYPTKEMNTITCKLCSVTIFDDADFLEHFQAEHSTWLKPRDLDKEPLQIEQLKHLIKRKVVILHWCPECQLSFKGPKLFENHARLNHPEYLSEEKLASPASYGKKKHKTGSSKGVKRRKRKAK